MKILLTGANGYIGQRLLPLLVKEGHQIVAIVRSKQRFNIPQNCKSRTVVLEGDFLKKEQFKEIPYDIDIAYYLIHSMNEHNREFNKLEEKTAKNFLHLIEQTNTKQIIYLSGLVNDKNLSPHLQSRQKVEKILHSGNKPVTTLKAGIILGSGSASFEIIRDLVEKLPLMIAPKWVEKKCQPIGIYDILEYLVAVINKKECLDQTFDVGGPDIMSYKEILLKFAQIRGLKRYILTIPVLTPNLSSYWLYFITNTNFPLARTLVESLKNDAICQENRIKTIIPKTCFHFEDSLRRTFKKIEENLITSSWKDSIVTSNLHPNLLEYIQVPEFGCLKDTQEVFFQCSPISVKNALWRIGGANGWYYMNFLWVARGLVDRLFGGSGLRRGRTHPTRLRNGDALDFWRVLLADEEKKRLLLYAEMRLPGEAWLEFEIISNEKQTGGILKQKATFRPNGLLGRLYWYGIYPFHNLIFKGLARTIIKHAITLS